MFRQAIKIDPDFSLAWAGFADCYSFLIMYVDPQTHYLEESKKVSNAARNQEVLLRALGELKEEQVLLDGHFCLDLLHPQIYE